MDDRAFFKPIIFEIAGLNRTITYYVQLMIIRLILGV